jgi:hypothetical protein
LSPLTGNREVVFSRCQPGELIDPVLVCRARNGGTAGILLDDDDDAGNGFIGGHRARAG